MMRPLFYVQFFGIIYVLFGQLRPALVLPQIYIKPSSSMKPLTPLFPLDSPTGFVEAQGSTGISTMTVGQDSAESIPGPGSVTAASLSGSNTQTEGVGSQATFNGNGEVTSVTAGGTNSLMTLQDQSTGDLTSNSLTQYNANSEALGQYQIFQTFSGRKSL